MSPIISSITTTIASTISTIIVTSTVLEQLPCLHRLLLHLRCHCDPLYIFTSSSPPTVLTLLSSNFCTSFLPSHFQILACFNLTSSDCYCLSCLGNRKNVYLSVTFMNHLNHSFIQQISLRAYVVKVILRSLKGIWPVALFAVFASVHQTDRMF